MLQKVNNTCRIRQSSMVGRPTSRLGSIVSLLFSAVVEEQRLAARGAPAFEHPDHRPGVQRDTDEKCRRAPPTPAGRPVPLALSSIAGPSRMIVVTSALFQKAGGNAVGTTR
jgi:hypothetical protein